MFQDKFDKNECGVFLELEKGKIHYIYYLDRSKEKNEEKIHVKQVLQAEVF